VWTFTACDLFNLTLGQGLILPQASDESLFANGKRCTVETIFQLALVTANLINYPENVLNW